MSRSENKRLYLILEKIDTTYAPTFSEIKNFLEDQGVRSSDRTIQRSIETLRDEYGIAIECTRSNNTYSINKEDSFITSNFLKLLNTAVLADILVESLKDYNNLNGLIQLDSDTSFKGFGILNDIIIAIDSKRKINIAYKAFYKEESKAYTIHPYLIKEYMNRWYVVGIDEEVNDFRTFGLERIEKLVLTTDPFKTDHDPKNAFLPIIGLNYNYSEEEEIVKLRFLPLQGKYIKTLRLHHSQEIITDNDKECIVQLTVKPNYELIQRILMYGNQVKVLEPEWLKEEVKTVLKAAVEQY